MNVGDRWGEEEPGLGEEGGNREWVGAEGETSYFFHTMNFLFCIEEQLINSGVIVPGGHEGTQPYTHMYPFSPNSFPIRHHLL